VATALGGCFLVILGTILALDQLGYTVPYRWLFLALLAPASSAIVDSFRVARVIGWRHVLPISRLVSGIIFGLIGILMSLRLNTGLILPALIVALGVVTVVRAVFGKTL
jgi:hypothetical protein